MANTLASPAKRGFRIATRNRIYQAVQILQQSRVLLRGALSPSAFPTDSQAQGRSLLRLLRLSQFFNALGYRSTRNSRGTRYRRNTAISYCLTLRGGDQTPHALVEKR